MSPLGLNEEYSTAGKAPSEGNVGMIPSDSWVVKLERFLVIKWFIFIIFCFFICKFYIVPKVLTTYIDISFTFLLASM